MNKIKTNLADCCLLTNAVHEDGRGRFVEIYKSSYLSEFQSMQTNISTSKQGVLRGIHRTPYAKLVTCVKGAIYDVCVDLRENSPTYLSHYAIILSELDMRSLYIPPYCGHGFYALEDSVVVYNQSKEYDPTVDQTHCYKSFNIDWPFINSVSLIISTKDSGVCNE